MKFSNSYYALSKHRLLFLLSTVAVILLLIQPSLASGKSKTNLILSSEQVVLQSGGNHHGNEESDHPWESFPAEEDQKEKTDEKDYDESDSNLGSPYRKAQDLNCSSSRFKCFKQAIAQQSRISLIILYHAWKSNLI
jgi:hypothetical protein